MGSCRVVNRVKKDNAETEADEPGGENMMQGSQRTTISIPLRPCTDASPDDYRARSGACDVAFSVTKLRRSWPNLLYLLYLMDGIARRILGGPPEILYTEYSTLINGARVTTGFGWCGHKNCVPFLLCWVFYSF